MTRRTLYRTLRRIRDKYNWYWEGGCIRGRKNLDRFCPITAVCYEKTGIYYKPSLYRLAAERIDFPIYEAENIASSADAWYESPGKLRIVQKALAKAVELPLQ